MAKPRAILKRRKAVQNIAKITKTMQMIATAKFNNAPSVPMPSGEIPKSQFVTFV